MIDLTLYSVRVHDRFNDDDPELATVIFAESFDGPWFDMATGGPDHCWEIVKALRSVQRPIMASEPTLDTRLQRAAVDSMMWDQTVGEAIDHALAEIARLRLENSDYLTRVNYLQNGTVRKIEE